MIVRFDTPEEAKKRFEELKEKHATSAPYQDFFKKRLDDEGLVEVRYFLFSDASIRVNVEACLLQNLATAMKIVDLMQEV